MAAGRIIYSYSSFHSFAEKRHSTQHNKKFSPRPVSNAFGIEGVASWILILFSDTGLLGPKAFGVRRETGHEANQEKDTAPW